MKQTAYGVFIFCFCCAILGIIFTTAFNRSELESEIVTFYGSSAIAIQDRYAVQEIWKHLHQAVIGHLQRKTWLELSRSYPISYGIFIFEPVRVNVSFIHGSGKCLLIWTYDYVNKRTVYTEANCQEVYKLLMLSGFP
jgi:hypothetical protein